MSKKPALLIALLIIVPACLWLGGTASLHYWIKHRKQFTEIAYTDLVFPWNWSNVRPKWGRHHIQKGQAYLAEKDWEHAFFYLRVGLKKAPDNLEGRLALANLLFQANQVPKAIDLLKGGIQYADQNEAFWEDSIRFLQYYQVDRDIIEILSNALDQGIIPEASQIRANFALAQALFHQGDYNATEKLCSDQKAPSFKLLKIRCLWERGLQNLALGQLETFLLIHPSNHGALAYLADWYSELGETNTALNLAESAYLRAPDSYELAEIWWRHIPDETELADALDQYERLNPGTLLGEAKNLRFFNLLAERGWPKLFAQWKDALPASRQENALLGFLELECSIRAQDWDHAESLYESLGKHPQLGIPLFNTLYNSFGLLLASKSGATESAERHYQTLISLPHIRPETLLRISAQLREAGLPGQAHRIIRFLLLQNPGNHQAMVERIQIELALNHFQEAYPHIQVLQQNHRLPISLRDDILHYLASDQIRYQDNSQALLDSLLKAMPPGKRKDWLSTFEL